MVLGVLPVSPNGTEAAGAQRRRPSGRGKARKLGRGLTVLNLPKADGPAIVESCARISTTW